MGSWLRRLAFLLRQSRHEADLREEIEAHRALRAAHLERDGLTPQQAADASRRAIGNVLLAREDAREVWLGSWGTLWQDAREVSRSLARSPYFTIPVVLSLALAIGANVAAFSVVNALALRPLPVSDPHSLFLVTYTDGARSDAGGNYAWYEYMREGARSFSTVFVADRETLRIGVNGRVEAVAGLEVTGNYFDSLGVRPRSGRLLTATDQGADVTEPVAVISDRFWASRFGRSPSAIGSSIDVGEVPHRIIGVTPPSFFGLEVGRHPDVTVPMDPAAYRRGWVSMAIVVRPRAGVSPAAAAQELTTLLRAFAAEFPARASLATQRIELTGIARGIATSGSARDRFTRPAAMVAVMLGLMLLVASTNWAVLLLARASARRRDVAIRLALGSSRAQVARRVAIEAVVLATAGGAVGMLAASWTAAMLPGSYLPDDLSIGTDARVALFATTLSLLITSVVAAAPIWLVGRMEAGALRAPSRIADVREGGVARRLIAVQVALGVVLVAAAAFFGATARNLQQQNLGFVADGVVTFVLDADGTGLEGDALQAHHRRLLESLRALPSVQTATLASVSPLSGNEDGKAITIPGFTARDADDLMANVSTVGPGYFDTYGIRILRGRPITDTDGASPHVAVISYSAARYYFGDADPIGRRLEIRGSTTLRPEIVGVAADVMYDDLRSGAERMFYVPFSQRHAEGAYQFAVRIAGDPNQLASAIPDLVSSMAPAFPVLASGTMTRQVEARAAHERVLAAVAAGMAAVALLLTGIGVYGIVGYTVARRTPELGLRIALGASRSSIFWQAVRRDAPVVGIGIAAGVAVAAASSGALRSVLFGIERADPRVYAAAAAALGLIGLLAVMPPAWRAMRIQPLTALREE